MESNHKSNESHIKRQYIEFDRRMIKENFEDLLTNTDLILAPFRGGSILGVFLSHLQNTPTHVIFPKNNYYIYPGFGQSIKNILITEDVVDTGETLRKICHCLKTFRYDMNIAVAALAAKPEGIKVAEELGVDLHYLEYVPQESWAVFPWEGSSPQQEK